jgi:divalent metal cation (Fe/Co/Zn/Cd) transporter
MSATNPAPSAQTSSLQRRARLLVWATIVWNTVEAVVALAAGAAASSGALVSFGLDSTIEVSAAFVALWYLRGESEEREQRAGRLIGLSFWALAAWVSFDAVTDLVAGDQPDVSAVGLVLTGVSVVVMPALAIAKRHTAGELGSSALRAESNETMVCAYLSAAVLAGLGANALFGWWWADPVAALVVAAIAANEGREAWHGELLEDGGCC